MSRAFLLALFAAAATLPYWVPIHNLPLSSFYNEWAGGVLWVAILLCVALQTRLAPAAAFPRVALVPAGLLAVLGVQALVLTVPNPTALRFGMGYLALATLLTYVGYRLRNLAGLTGVLAAALVVGALGSCLIEAVQACHPMSSQGGHIVLRVFDPRSNGRLFANLAQPNHLATYLSWGLAGALYLRVGGVLSWRAVGVMIALILCGMSATGSRIALVHVLWIGTVFGVLDWRRLAGPSWQGAVWRSAWRISLWPVCLLLAYLLLGKLVDGVSAMAHLGLHADAMERMEAGGSMEGRLRLWHYGWQMFLHAPLLGGGWGGFVNWQYQHLDTLGPVEMAISAHDIVLDLLAQTGLIGGAIFLLGMAFWAWRAALQRLTLSRAFWYCLIGTILAHALVEFPLNYTYFLFPFAFALGMLDTAPLRCSGLRWPVLLSSILLPVLMASLMILMTDIHKLERFYYSTDVLAGMNRYWDDQAVLLNRYGAFAVADAVSVNGLHPEARLEMQRDALGMMPMAGTITNYVVVLALLGHDAEALEQVRRLRLFAPDDYRANFLLLLTRVEAQGPKLAKFTAQLMAMKPPRPAPAPPRTMPSAGDGLLGQMPSLSMASGVKSN